MRQARQQENSAGDNAGKSSRGQKRQATNPRPCVVEVKDDSGVEGDSHWIEAEHDDRDGHKNQNESDLFHWMNVRTRAASVYEDRPRTHLSIYGHAYAACECRKWPPCQPVGFDRCSRT